MKPLFIFFSLFFSPTPMMCSRAVSDNLDVKFAKYVSGGAWEMESEIDALLNNIVNTLWGQQ